MVQGEEFFLMAVKLLKMHYRNYQYDLEMDNWKVQGKKVKLTRIIKHDGIELSSISLDDLSTLLIGKPESTYTIRIFRLDKDFIDAEDYMGPILPSFVGLKYFNFRNENGSRSDRGRYAVFPIYEGKPDLEVKIPVASFYFETNRLVLNNNNYFNNGRSGRLLRQENEIETSQAHRPRTQGTKRKIASSSDDEL